MKAQELAAKKRDAAQRRVELWMRRTVAAAKMMEVWKQRADRYNRAANMTDEEVAKIREARKNRPAKKGLRGVDLS